jgi:hypothetical protein
MVNKQISMFYENVKIKNDQIYEINSDANNKKSYKLSEKLFYVHKIKRKIKKAEIKCQVNIDSKKL